MCASLRGLKPRWRSESIRVMGASLATRPDRNTLWGGSRCERTLYDPKDRELYLPRAKPEEILVEARSGSDVQIDRQM